MSEFFITVILLFSFGVIWLIFMLRSFKSWRKTRRKDDAALYNSSHITDSNEAKFHDNPKEQGVRKNDQNISSQSIVKILAERVTHEEQIQMEVEDIPLDNRFGSSTLISEHQFTRSATNSLQIEYAHNLDGRISGGVNLLGVLEVEIKKHFSKSIGIKVDETISRQVTITLEAPPKHSVHYRVIWKQTKRHGVIDYEFNGQLFQVPYTVNYGLYHSTTSIAPGEC